MLLPLRALEAVAGLGPRFDRLNEVLDDLSAEIRLVRSDLATLQSRIDRIGADVSPVDEDLHEVTQAVLVIAPQLSEVRDHIDMLRQDLSGLPFVGRN